MAEETGGTPIVNGDSFEIQVEIQRQINQLRREQLNYRFKVVDWCLAGFTLIFVIATLGLGWLVYSNKQETSQLRTEAENFLETLKENTNTISDLGVVRDLRDGVYRDVPVDSFIPVVVASELVTEEEITSFVNNAHKFFVEETNRNSYKAEYNLNKFRRREITVDGGGAVQIFRINSEQEFLAAWDGVLQVLQALKKDEDLPGIKILVRGTERFFDIKGIGEWAVEPGLRLICGEDTRCCSSRPSHRSRQRLT